MKRVLLCALIMLFGTSKTTTLKNIVKTVVSPRNVERVVALGTIACATYLFRQNISKHLKVFYKKSVSCDIFPLVKDFVKNIACQQGFDDIEVRLYYPTNDLHSMLAMHYNGNNIIMIQGISFFKGDLCKNEYCCTNISNWIKEGNEDRLEEVEAIVLHELGHLKHKHLTKKKKIVPILFAVGAIGTVALVYGIEHIKQLITKGRTHRTLVTKIQGPLILLCLMQKKWLMVCIWDLRVF